jgi:hypothetical protein
MNNFIFPCNSAGMPGFVDGLEIGVGWVVAVNDMELDSGLGLQAVTQSEIKRRVRKNLFMGLF